MIRKLRHIDPDADREKIMAAVKRELYEIGLDLERIAVDYIKRKNISVDGDLKKSIKSLVEPILKGLRLEFGSNVPHAIYVHEGTKPHWPPHKPIRRWVRKKLNPPVDAIDSIAFLVRRKISEVGTPAKPFLAVALRAIKPPIPTRIQHAVNRAI